MVGLLTKVAAVKRARVAATALPTMPVAGVHAATGSPPPDAADVDHIRKTFSSFTPGDIDIDDTGKSGIAWYFRDRVTKQT
jgi:hypothetical protein